MEQAPARTRLDSLTGLRAVAALAVALDHVGPLVSGRPAAVLHHVGVQGAMGVTFFFALSGFVLTWSARPGDRARDFYRRRLARVYPAYLVALLAGVMLTHVERGPVEPGPAITSVLLLQSWVPSLGYYFAINGVGWSLSCEAFFYLCFPAVVPALLRLGRPGRRALQVALLLALLGADVVGTHIGGVVGSSWIVLHLPLVRVLEFLLGCTVAVDLRRGARSPGGVPLAAALVLGAWLLGGWWTTGFTNVAIPVVPFLLLLLACARRDVEGRPTVFAHPVLVRLGEVSFAFYLVHQMVVRLEMRLLGTGIGAEAGALRLAVFLAASLAVAWLLHVVVEVPCERLLRGRPRRSALPAIPAQRTGEHTGRLAAAPTGRRRALHRAES